jgi:hypothetical protein
MTQGQRSTGENELRHFDFDSLDRLLDTVYWLEKFYQPLVEIVEEVETLLRLCLKREFQWTEVEELAYLVIYKEMDNIMKEPAPK